LAAYSLSFSDVLWGMIYFPVFEALKKRWSSTDVRSNELSLKTLYYQTSTAAAAAATATLLTAVHPAIPPVTRSSYHRFAYILGN